MKKLLELLRETIREYNTYRRDYRRLQKSTLDYAALQNMVNQVADRGVVIDITFDNGNRLTISRQPEQPQIQSFQDRYRKAHQ